MLETGLFLSLRAAIGEGYTPGAAIILAAAASAALVVAPRASAPALRTALKPFAGLLRRYVEGCQCRAILGFVSREAMARWRGRLLHVGKGGKIALGSILVVMGALVLSGLDKQVETFLVNSSPHWLTDLTTRF
jgi:hypothetical protein